MERIPTCSTPLIGNLPIGSHDAVTNRTFGLSLQRTLHVSPPCGKRIDQAAVEYRNRAQRRAQPGLPLLLVDSDAVEAFDMSVREREGRRKGYAHAHSLLIEDVRSGNFACARGDADAKRVVGGGA